MKILIIKLSAIGDVLRTTTLLPGLKRAWPDSGISWVTSQDAIGLLRENNFIDILLAYNRKNIKCLEGCAFDLLICLDKEKESTMLASRLTAARKIGFGSDGRGRLCIFNKESEYAYELGISNELKFRLNKKTYPEIIYEMCALEYKGDRYILNLTDRELVEARSKLRSIGIREDDFVVGLNTGAGHRFANKIWAFEKHKSLIKEILKKKDINVLLLGGRREEGLNQRLKKVFGDDIYNSGSRNRLREFASIVKHCNAVISGDTLAMQVAIALDRYTIAIFGPTCSQEIELYGNGVRVVPEIECSPCYKRQCNKKDNCMSRIRLEEVIKALNV